MDQLKHLGWEEVIEVMHRLVDELYSPISSYVAKNDNSSNKPM